MEGVTVKAISSQTRRVISELLNPEMPISTTEEGFARDWRGLFDLCGIDGMYMENLRDHQDPAMKILRLWQEKDKIGSTVDVFLSFLERIDRYDVVYDIMPMLEEDCKAYKEGEHDEYEPPFEIYTIDDVARNNQGLDDPQMYDAFVLFVEDDINFATELIETLERQYSLKLCTKDRDVIASGDEHVIMMKIIKDRCKKLILILSPAFITSPLHRFFLRFGQGMALETKQDKIIPCVCKHFDKIPDELVGYFMLDYTRATFWNFWDRLYNSIKKPTKQPSKNRLLQQRMQSRQPQRKLSNGSSAVQDKDMLKPIAQAVKFSSMVNLNSNSETERFLKDQPLSASPSVNNLGNCQEKKNKPKNWLKKLKNNIKPNKQDKKKCWNLQNKKAAAVAENC